MSKESVVIPQQLQQYINQCLDDAELKSLKTIPVKIFGYAVNLREYYDFERRELRQFKSQTITITDIQALTEQEIAQYKIERANKLYKYYPALPSQEPAVTTAPVVSTAAVIAAAASVSDIPDYQPLVEILRRQRQESRAKAASSAQPSVTAAAINPLSSADTTESTINSQTPLPANTRIKLHRQTNFAQTTPSEKQQSASTDFFRRNSSASSSTTNINPSAPRSDDKTPLLRKSRTTKKL